MASIPPPIDPSDQNFIREVDEQYRAEQLKEFARKYGRWILLVVGIGLVVLAAVLFWRAEEAKKLDALSEQFTGAVEDAESGATKPAAKEFADISESGNAAYRTLSRLAEAGLSYESGDAKKATADLEAILKDGKAPKAMRDAAQLKLLQLQFDSLPPATVIQKTAPYLEGDNPWFAIAGELAALAHLKNNEPEKAGPLYYRIASDTRVPQSLRARAEQMAASLGQDVTKLMDSNSDEGTTDGE